MAEATEIEIQRKTLPDLLRLFLALEVVAIHCLEFYRYRFYVPIPPVPAFVCLSGLLIPGSFTQSRGWTHFAWKRLLRVIPALAASFILVALLFGPGTLIPTFLFYISTGFVLLASKNPPLWSLALEEILYGFHVVSRKLGTIWSPIWAGGCLLVSAAVWIALRSPGTYDLTSNPDHHMAPISAFFAGNLLSFYRDRLARFWIPILPILAASSYTYSVAQASVLVVCSTTAVSVCAIVLAWGAPSLKFTIPDYSYGIYIYHAPFALLLRDVRLSNGEKLAITLLAVGCLSVASWKWLEKPALSLKNWRPQNLGSA